METIETVPSEEYHRIGHSASEEPLDEEAPLLLQETDLEKLYYRKWSYLPPLNKEATAIIDAIIANPDMVNDFSRTGPENVLFDTGLEDRNVSDGQYRRPHDSYSSSN